MIHDNGLPDNGLPSAVLALHRTTHHTLHALSMTLADLTLTPAEMNALANLAELGALSVSRLSTATGTKSSTLTGVLDRLERRGYLARELDAADRRSFRLVLTGPGAVAARQVHAAVTALEERALASLSPAQVAGYHAVITALEEAC
ncbi:MAG TPA: MarR family transcriptional regulator [Streptosporangiaceae bacterium]|nr:MarR family transcriptional regulator [Streptosporangiaceae bacterium]